METTASKYSVAKVDREHPVVDLGVEGPPVVLRGAEPQVGRPHLHAELAPEENRRQRPPAAQVQHAQAGAQVERPASQRTWAPPLGPARTHSGWYFAVRGNLCATPCSLMDVSRERAAKAELAAA
jgi:hypothetical protein